MNKIYYDIEGHKGCFYNADISEITAEEAASDWYDEALIDPLNEDGAVDYENATWFTQTKSGEYVRRGSE